MEKKLCLIFLTIPGKWNNECFPCDTPEEIIVGGAADYNLYAEKPDAVCPNRTIVAAPTPLSMLSCPKDKSKLNRRECSECGGVFADGTCRSGR